MEELPSSVRAVRFGVFEVDLRARELRKRGIRVKLQGQPYVILVTLLAQRGEPVSREELRGKLWPGDTFIDFDHSLATAVNKLREVLGDSADSPRFIETLPRLGYRFIAPIEAIGPAAPIETPVAGPVLPASSPSEGPGPRPIDVPGKIAARDPAGRPFVWKISLLVVLVVGAALSLWMIRPWSRSPSAIRSLAVLPLENLSHDIAQDYFSDGMTDELITELGRIGELRVISRTSVMTYKGAHKRLPQIAQELNVDAVVEGTVLRSGSRVRITAQLIQASSDKHLWAESYEGELQDTLALQNKVARAIAEQIRIKLSPGDDKLKIARVLNHEAYEDYLKGRYFWNKRTGDGLRKAVNYFDQAIEKDPNYAQAYSGLADSYALMGDWEYGIMAPKEAFPKAKAAATKALELDNTLGEAHTSLAFCHDVFDWDWSAAEKEYLRSIELSPSYATAHHWYAWHLIVVGRNPEAIAEMRKAENLDPLSLIVSADMADLLLVARFYEQSAQQSRKTIEMDPGFALGHYLLGQSFAQQHMYNEAIAELQKAIALSSGNTTFASGLAYVYAISGKKPEAAKILEDLKARSNHGSPNAPEIALVYVGLQQNDEAMSWLERAYEERFNPSILLRPCFDRLRSEPRFQELLRLIGVQH
jgi:TolB-like protein/DNA-binding winged helix-turn-helix (wHTH) protein/Flp pilus assembly protein TadD